MDYIFDIAVPILRGRAIKPACSERKGNQTRLFRTYGFDNPPSHKNVLFPFM
jgi:hypothetical protein